ncbi:NucA/NucB deoxyribonuclease domain-containing protein [Corynebacterium macclintockiae]|uniref:NucA/NucB deoxyribonuclease domain-containing protein n=1 Tax=Corynebacterium macclintockiae TaxID=2913501 RepID=UPI003D7147FE
MYGFNEAAAANRYDATKSWDRSRGSPDECPFASTAQGSTGSHLNGFSVAAQRSQGGQGIGFKSILS